MYKWVQREFERQMKAEAKKPKPEPKKPEPAKPEPKKPAQFIHVCYNDDKTGRQTLAILDYSRMSWFRNESKIIWDKEKLTTSIQKAMKGRAEQPYLVISKWVSGKAVDRSPKDRRAITISEGIALFFPNEK